MKNQHTLEQWIDLISKEELPAITSTVKMLDKFSNDDKSSLVKLSNAILYDQGLSSCLLKVANNINHLGVSKVTTVSRATVVLGIRAVKNICLTSKIVKNLLQSKSLKLSVYHKLTQQMANSFYAGMLAKMMVPEHATETQEEIYLAAMLYRVGESAFWSLGGEAAIEMSKYPPQSAEDFAYLFQQKVGLNIDELNIALANKWNLSDLLVKALSSPTSRTDEIKIIYFANLLSSSIANPPETEENFNTMLETIAELMNIKTSQLKAKIVTVRKQSLRLLSSYDASILGDLIKPLPSPEDFIAKKNIKSYELIDKNKALFDAFVNLTNLTKTSQNINAFLHQAIVDMSHIFSLDRCFFLTVDEGRHRVTSRFIVDKQGENDELKIHFTLYQSETLIEYVLSQKKAILINNTQADSCRQLINREMLEFINNGVIALAPVKVGEKVIGIICAQILPGKDKDKDKDKDKIEIDEESYQQFCSLVEHLNMCLMIILHK